MKSWIAATVVTIGLTSIAYADEAKYGGQVKDMGAYEGELVVKGTDVHLYLIKDHKALTPGSNLAASLRLFVNNKETKVDLKPEGNKLVGKTEAPSTGPVRAMATLTDNGKEVGKAQYSMGTK